jgi:hypothetical protein
MSSVRKRIRCTGVVLHELLIACKLLPKSILIGEDSLAEAHVIVGNILTYAGMFTGMSQKV